MVKKRGVKRIAFFMALVLGMISLPDQPVKAEVVDNSSNKIHFIALDGHSDAILLESNGHFGMVDSGEDTDYPDGSDSRYPLRDGIVKTAGFEDEVIAYMKSVGVTKYNFDFYLGTHPHSDHIGSADEIIREFRPERVYIMEYRDEYISSDSNLWDNLYVYDNMIAAAQEVGAVLIQNFDEDAPVEPDQGGRSPSLPFSQSAATAANGTDQDENSVYADESEEDEAAETASSGKTLLAEPQIVDMEEDDREYAFLSQSEVEEQYGVNPLNPDDPQAADSEPDDGSGFPVLLSDDPNSTRGISNESTTGNPNFSLGDMEIHVLNYSDDYKTTPKPDCNYFSLGVLVEVNGYRTFLGGDIGNYDGDEDRLAAYLGEVDVLKLGHHGLASSNTVNYLNALQPDYMVSTGVFSVLYASDGRIDAIDRLAESKGTRLYFTREYAMADQGDSVVLAYDGNEIKTNVSAETPFFYSCSSMPYVYCYQDGYKHPYTGFVKSSGEKYFFSESVKPVTSQWISYEDKWYYATETGAMQTGWMGNYYFNDEGVWIEHTVQEGWVKDSNGWWYRNPDNTYPKEQWKLIQGYYYYFDARGYMVTGWLNQDGKWYYLKSNGAMAVGWVQVGSKWYYMNSSGVMQTGWLKTGGKYYYLDQNGVMQTGWLNLDGVWYYLDEKGAMATGWVQVGSRWYYMDKSGAMQTGWQVISGKKYYLEESGAMAYGRKQIDGLWYYFGTNGDGVMKTGWQKIDGSWFYMNGDGVQQTGWQNISGKRYYFKESGVMVAGWQKINGEWYYFDSSGIMQTGWQKIGTKWYYMNEDGVMQSDCWIDDCYVGPDGAWVQGKVKEQ